MSEIVVDTYKLEYFSGRITDVNDRIGRLNERINNLYEKTGLLCLREIKQDNILSKYSSRLRKCKDYLDQTAFDFECLEKSIDYNQYLTSVASSSKLSVAEANDQSYKDNIIKELQNIEDVMQWIDDNYSNLPEPVQLLLKDACKKLFKKLKLSENLVSAYEIFDLMLEGDVWGVIWKSVGALAPSTFDWKNNGAINWTGLKIKAVSIVGGLVTDENGYIQVNDRKYMQMMEDSFMEADILGFVWNGAASFFQTVGKGVVDGTCQLISGAFDSVTEKATERMFGYGISWSTLNAIVYEDWGWSPGSVFNDVSGAISNGVDAFWDGGAEFWSAFSEQTYSDFKDFGELVGDAANATADYLESAADTVGDWIKSWV